MGLFPHLREPDITDDTALARMEARTDGLLRRMVYSRRLGNVEPLFGNLCHHRRLDRFTLHGVERPKNENKGRVVSTPGIRPVR